MKKTILQVSLFCLAFAATSSIALAQTEIIGPDVPLSNAGFESPVGQKITNFFLAYPWQDTGVNYTNSGVQPDSGAHSGANDAYEDTVDDGAYQIDTYVGYQITNGDMITLSWWAEGSYNGTNTTFTGTGPTDPIQQVSLLKAASQSDAYSATILLAGQTNGLPGTQAGWVQYTVNYTATPADAGNYLGVSFFTTTADGKIPNSFALYDDFSLYVLPAGSKPVILSPPASQTAYTGATVTFTVSAIDATSYQWMAGAPGSGVYTNLINGGQFSGVTGSTLTITNATVTNNADYVVVVANANGSVTSAPPANLTVASILYQETFSTGIFHNQAITNAGWVNDIHDSDTRLYVYGTPSTNLAVYSYTSIPWTEAFYTTVSLENGSITNQQPFPNIDLSMVQNMTFAVDLQSGFAPNTVISYFCVQIDSGNWYVSTNGMTFTSTAANFVTYTMPFNPSSNAWNQLTVSGTGMVSSTAQDVVGGLASTNLSGHITGAGLVCVHSGNGTHDFDNFTIAGAVPPNFNPVINSPPLSTTNYTGNTVTFSVAATTNGSTTGLTYQWMDATVGSGVYANLSNGGQYSGVNSPTLTISNIASAANHKNYVVVVTDAAGSVTSTPPATLTVIDSAPILTADTIVSPNAIHAGNNNIVILSASFTGDFPIAYQWQISPNSSGSGAVNIPGATTSTYALSYLQTNNTGYYSLQASNSQSGATPVNSSWAPLTVAPVSTAFYRWSAPVSINGLTATQILSGQNGAFFEAEVFNGPAASVTNGSTVFAFDDTGSVATMTGEGGPGTGGNAFSGTTGDTNLDAVLTEEVENSSPTITINNLTPGQAYSVQLFAIDDNQDPSRLVSYADTNDTADVSSLTAVGSNSYIVGFFTATNTTAAINVVEPTGHGYFNCLIVRTVTTPRLSIQRSGANALVNWDFGTLLQANSIIGPWTTNYVGAPYLVAPTPTTFYRIHNP